MKTQIKKGNFYAKIPLKELAAPRKPTSIDIDGLPGMDRMSNLLYQKAENHNKAVDNIFKDFAKRNAKEAGVSVKDLYDYLDNQLRHDFKVNS